MRHFKQLPATPVLVTLLLLIMSCFSYHSFAQETIPSSDSDHFPSGKILGPYAWKSQIYPGTERNYWIYVPAQYDANKPACSMIVQDGLGRAQGWGLLPALDSLIHAKAIPVIVGIFVDHGKVPSEGEDHYPRFNRSNEYDAMGDRYARFLLEELLPEVEKSYNLSHDPNDRSIAGASSGAICAFNAAWERPDAFNRVLSTIGTYVGLRGGDEFPTLVRKTEPKPLRVFLEDGNSDLNIYAGDWWMANQDMLSALTWAGYEVTHIWGEEGHNSRGAKKIIDKALQWLWEGYPSRVETHPDRYQGLQLAIPGETWQLLTLPELQVSRLAVDDQGRIVFSDTHSNSLYEWDEKGVFQLFLKLSFRIGGLALDEQGRLWVADLDHRRIVTIDKNGEMETMLEEVNADQLLVSSKGLYFTDYEHARIGYWSAATGQLTYIEVPERPTGLSLSAEQTFLNVTVGEGTQGYSYKISGEGHLIYGQTYIHYHIPYGKPTAKTGSICVDANNRTYTATAMGIQVADQLGRINYIFSQPAKKHSDVKIGGKELDTLFLICDGRLYSRKINAKGVVPWKAAVKPPQPRM
ncbi:MAG: alpha/beta hydrolase-fold protein [Saprospiraceae bacterium]